MKEGRRIGGVHAGPESRVLEGVSWDEARQMQDAQPSNLGKQIMTFNEKLSFFVHKSFFIVFKLSSPFITFS